MPSGEGVPTGGPAGPEGEDDNPFRPGLGGVKLGNFDPRTRRLTSDHLQVDELHGKTADGLPGQRQRSPKLLSRQDRAHVSVMVAGNRTVTTLSRQIRSDKSYLAAIHRVTCTMCTGDLVVKASLHQPQELGRLPVGGIACRDVGCPAETVGCNHPIVGSGVGQAVN